MRIPYSLSYSGWSLISDSERFRVATSEGMNTDLQTLIPLLPLWDCCQRSFSAFLSRPEAHPRVPLLTLLSNPCSRPSSLKSDLHKQTFCALA